MPWGVVNSLCDFLSRLREQRFRTLSTVLGIAWGTLAVILLIAFGRGLQFDLIKRAEALGKSIVVAWPQDTTRSYQGLAKGRAIRLRAEDVMNLPRLIPELAVVSAEYQDYDRVEVNHRVHALRLSGVYPSFAELRMMIPQPGGRFLDWPDIRERRRVLFLGNRIKEDLFGAEEAVGRHLILRGVPFTVVGVLKPKEQDSDYGGKDEHRIYLPATTHAQLFNRDSISLFVFRARDLRVHRRAIDRVYQVLGRLYRFDPNDRVALSLWDTTENDRVLTYFFLGFNAVLGGSGVLTLFIGGIGVANLMYILVRQRTREIAIQMAIGARPRRILFQVMGQTLGIVFGGGVLGILISGTVVWLAHVSGLTAQIGAPAFSPFLAASTVLLLTLIGLIAGYFPARRAAQLDPALILSEE